MATAVTIGATLCFGGTQNCAFALLLFVGTAVLWHPWMKREGGVPVLVYHSVTSQGDWLPWSEDISVTPELFARNLKTLKALNCNVVRTGDLVDARRTGRSLGKRPVVIHFDDGYLDNWVAAMPLLKRFNMPATVFVSTDFIEPGTELRPNLDDVESGKVDLNDLRWDGYLNWSELSVMQRSGLIDIEAHGVDHGRVATGPEIKDTLTLENWRHHAWMQWREMGGNKSAWYRNAEPPVVPAGTAIPQNASALAARSWSNGALESQVAYDRRVAASLESAKSELEQRLGKKVSYFCWPYNETNARARGIALEAGFKATTGGDGENCPGEDPTIISRYHVGAGALGRPHTVLDDIVFLASVRLFHGNYYWGLLVLPLNAGRRISRILTRLRPGGKALA